MSRRLLDPKNPMKYKPSYDTDIRETFKRVRRAQEKAKQQQPIKLEERRRAKSSQR